MFGLTTLGAIHTAISLVAVVTGVMALIREKRIVPDSKLGKVYIWTTVLTCLTGFGIFQHGGFGAPHILGVLTLLTFGLGALAGRTQLLGRVSTHVETVSYSLTFFFHMIPGVTETFTRLPASGPLFTSPEDPALQKVVSALFLVFVIGATLQVRRQRALRPQFGPRGTAGRAEGQRRGF